MAYPNRAAAFRGFVPGGLFNVCPQAPLRHPRSSRVGQTSNKPKPFRSLTRCPANGGKGRVRPLILADSYCPRPFLLAAIRLERRIEYGFTAYAKSIGPCPLLRTRSLPFRLIALRKQRGLSLQVMDNASDIDANSWKKCEARPDAALPGCLEEDPAISLMHAKAAMTARSAIKRYGPPRAPRTSYPSAQ